MQFNGNLSFVAVPNLPNFGKKEYFFVCFEKKGQALKIGLLIII